MPRETHASIDPSFAPPRPVEKTVGEQFAEPGPPASRDWTSGDHQSASQVAAGAKGQRHVVNPSVQQIRREAEGG